MLASGKTSVSGSRKDLIVSSGNLSERSLTIADTVREIGASPSQVAIAWTLLNSAVVSPIIGARTLAQLEENLGALAIRLSKQAQEKLEAVSAPEAIFPFSIFNRPSSRNLVFGGLEIGGAAR